MSVRDGFYRTPRRGLRGTREIMKTQGNQIAGSVIPWPCVFTPAGGGAHQGGDEDIEPQLIRVAFSAKTEC